MVGLVSLSGKRVRLEKLEVGEEGVKFMKIAVIGATGAVGREMLTELEKLPRIDIELGLFASPKVCREIVKFSWTPVGCAILRARSFA